MNKFIVGTRGLETPKCEAIEPNRGYFLGASSSPDYVIVLSVTDEHIVYAHSYTHHRTVCERWIAEDLIARGGATARAQSPRRAMMHGAPAATVDFDRVRVVVAASKEFTGQDLWRAAEVYGNVGGTDGGYEIETTALQLEQLERNERFVVRSVKILSVCPTQ